MSVERVRCNHRVQQTNNKYIWYPLAVGVLPSISSIKKCVEKLNAEDVKKARNALLRRSGSDKMSEDEVDTDGA